MTSVPQTLPPPGMAHWLLDPPWLFDVVEVWRKGYMQTRYLRVADANPLMNVWGLWWRPLKPYRADETTHAIN